MLFTNPHGNNRERGGCCLQILMGIRGRGGGVLFTNPHGHKGERGGVLFTNHHGNKDVGVSFTNPHDT